MESRSRRAGCHRRYLISGGYNDKQAEIARKERHFEPPRRQERQKKNKNFGVLGALAVHFSGDQGDLCSSPAVREATRDVVVEAQVPNNGRALLPGMFADV